MPSDKILKKKQKQVEDLSNIFKSTLVGILVDYKGINVLQDTSLRKDLRELNVNYKVTKNTILKRAFDMAGIIGLDGFLVGSTAVAISNSNYSDAARVLCKFADTNNFYKIKAGFVEGKFVTKENIKVMSSLPDREQLVANVLCSLISPVNGFVFVLNNLIRSLAVIFSEISNKNSI
ncbi:MAG: 50S ribosomal protein L10 [Firmicutes bacterium]|nr:50S ribosomal protein L10 [Bacillota bacterium]